MFSVAITEQTLTTERHTCSYLAAGPEDGPLIIFVHGWPELSLSWRHQLPFFAGMGFRVIAPDMRGYGKSSVYSRHEDYCLEKNVEDMIQLLDSLGRESAIWVGHDWGSPVVWGLASHHPHLCEGVASLCVPYLSIENGLDQLIGSVDRKVYPVDEFPAGQWEYMCFYEENFENATKVMDASPLKMTKLLFRKGEPTGVNKVTGTAMIRKTGGWFEGADEPPDTPRDEDILTQEDMRTYAGALESNGFFGPNSSYMNHKVNAEYTSRALNLGVIEIPALFLGGRFDFTCETISSSLAEPMRKYCRNLSEAVIDSGHWMAQEKPSEVNRELVKWLVNQDLCSI